MRETEIHPKQAKGVFESEKIKFSHPKLYFKITIGPKYDPFHGKFLLNLGPHKNTNKTKFTPKIHVHRRKQKCKI